MNRGTNSHNKGHIFKLGGNCSDTNGSQDKMRQDLWESAYVDWLLTLSYNFLQEGKVKAISHSQAKDLFSLSISTNQFL